MTRPLPFVGAVRQTIWGWPAVLNLFLGGLGSLFYAATFVFDGSLSEQIHASELTVWRLIGPGLTVLGFLAVVTEAGRPSRAVFLLHHLYRSWMSREVLAGGLFIGSAFGYALLPLPALKWLAIATAVGLSLCQAIMLYDSMGVTIWNDRIVPLQCLTANMLAAAMVLLTFVSWSARVPLALAATSLSLMLLDGGAWLLLLRHQSTPEHRDARKPLLRTLPLMLVFGIGHLLPFLLLLSTLAISGIGYDRSVLVGSLVSMATLMVLTGGLAQKAGVVLGGNSLRPMRRGDNYFHFRGVEGG